MYDYLEANNEANRRRALAWFPSISRHPDVSRDIRSLSGSTGARLSLGDKEAEDLLDFPATRTSSDPCTTSSSTSCTSTWKTFRSPQLEKKKYIYVYMCVYKKKERGKRILSILWNSKGPSPSSSWHLVELRETRASHKSFQTISGLIL